MPIPNTEAAPTVGVVTVNYNSAAFVEEFLDSLARLDHPDARLVVVDAGSTDGSADLVERRRPDAHVIRCEENVGIAKGNNIGARYCADQQMPFICFINNDTTHEPDFLTVLLGAAGPRTMVVPRILYSGDHRLISTHAGDFDWTLGRFRNTFHGKRDQPATRQRRELRTASFCAILVPTAAFAEVGTLDERFFMYYEETDWLRQALDLGYGLVYVPEAVVYHQESASSGGGWMTPFKLYYATRNRLLLVRKNRTSALRYGIFTVYFWVTRVPHVLRYLVTGQRAMLRALVLGMRDYYRRRLGRTLEVHDL